MLHISTLDNLWANICHLEYLSLIKTIAIQTIVAIST